ncbi:S24 family peptidase [uncultured Alistipes sp.]|uniref:S24 family peptidase n=1 Tax=uncultured Alistipes sp. TaxID=538949 RepID=UPI002803AE1D|nr:S24 family peptidase [uncultured Alistipes sp.]
MADKIISAFPEIDRSWLLSGEGNMLKPMETVFVKKSDGIPFYDMDVTAGITESFADVREEVQYYINYPPLNDCDAAFPVYGDSMEPDFYPGDVVLVREIRNVDSMLWGEPYLIITDATCDNLRTIKNVYLSEDRRSFILRATNPKYSGDTIVPRDNVLKIFLVKGKVARRQL